MIDFEVLPKLVRQNALSEPAVIKLNSNDLARLPADFQKKASDAAANGAGAEITVSNEPANITGGFLLIYKGIDMNCSFDAIFEDAIDSLRDVAGDILFPTASDE